jgi:hypothetical protein
MPSSLSSSSSSAENLTATNMESAEDTNTSVFESV